MHSAKGSDTFSAFLHGLLVVLFSTHSKRTLIRISYGFSNSFNLFIVYSRHTIHAFHFERRLSNDSNLWQIATTTGTFVLTITLASAIKVKYSLAQRKTQIDKWKEQILCDTCSALFSGPSVLYTQQTRSNSRMVYKLIYVRLLLTFLLHDSSGNSTYTFMDLILYPHTETTIPAVSNL